MLKLLYCNLNRSRAAFDMMAKTASQMKADVTLCSEPNRTKISTSDWDTDDDLDVGIKLSSSATVSGKGKGKGFVWVQTNSVTIFACYISPNSTEQTFSTFLAEISSAIQKAGPSLVVGDFNAKSRIWGPKRGDRRGNLVAEWVARESLVIHNRGDAPTFRRNNQVSYIDLTISSASIANRVTNWKVDDETETLSDHNYISMHLEGPRTISQSAHRLTFRPHRVEHFRDSLRFAMDNGYAKSTEDFIDSVQAAAISSFKTATKEKCRRPVPWWSKEIEEARRDCIHSRREMKRSRTRDPEGSPDAERAYRHRRYKLRSLIKASKRAAFDRLIEEANSNPWGSAYQQSKRVCGSRPRLSEDVQIEEARKLFPQRPMTTWEMKPLTQVSRFSMDELKAVQRRIKSGKAPGPDGLSGEMIRTLLDLEPEECLRTFNQCLEKGNFPWKWKESTLVLIPKAMKPSERKQSYRPICLISILGKVLEGLLKARLCGHLWPRLAPLQFGFRPGYSTADAVQAVLNNSRRHSEEEIVVLVTLDIKNAFNSAPWDQTVAALRDFKVPEELLRMVKSYLTDRYLLVGNQRLKLSCGVPQGSVLGPILWNALYDAVVTLNIPGCVIVAFADDIALIIRGSSIGNVSLVLELATKTVTDKLRQLGLVLAPHKTEAVILHAPVKVKEIRFDVGGHEVKTQHSLKYLGVWLERKLRVGTHLEMTAAKAEKQVHALSRILSPHGPLRQRARHLYASVILSTVTYGTAAWYPLVKTKAEKALPESISRRVALRTSGAPWTISTAALEVLSGHPPMSLRLEESLRIGEGRPSDRRREAMERWQQGWEATDKAAWTRRLIPEVQPWVERTHGEMDRPLYELLSGHGWCRETRHRLGLPGGDHCPHCNALDTPLHVFTECRDGQCERDEVYRLAGGPQPPEQTVRAMLQDKDIWEAVRKMAAAIAASREGPRAN